jgi:hypothetical protein
MKLTIRPLAGIGELSFGANMSDIAELLGQPEDSEVLTDGEDEVETLIWNYWEQGLTLFIEGSDNSVFSNCEIENEDATLFGVRVFELDESGIIGLMKENGFTDYESEVEPWEEKRLTFEDAQTDFYFLDDKLTTVNWGVVVNDQGEIIN